MSTLLFTYPLNGIVLNNDGEIRYSEREFKEQSEIFKVIDNLTISGGFDYAFYKDIIIIPSIDEKKVPDMKSTIECQLEGMGDHWITIEQFILFLNYEEVPQNNELILIKSLSLPNRQFVKDKVCFRSKSSLQLLDTKKITHSYTYLD